MGDELVDEFAGRLEAAYEDFALRFCVRRSLDKSCCEVVEKDAVSDPVKVWRFATWAEAEKFHDTMLWKHVAKDVLGEGE